MHSVGTTFPTEHLRIQNRWLAGAGRACASPRGRVRGGGSGEDAVRYRSYRSRAARRAVLAGGGRPSSAKFGLPLI